MNPRTQGTVSSPKFFRDIDEPTTFTGVQGENLALQRGEDVKLAVTRIYSIAVLF
ncbi:hypothetical protein BN903_90 [Halorubrum sp. AJ67]|nr:hypothetical protein BN903_90 [Halorubrum sp. AJ67]